MTEMNVDEILRKMRKVYSVETNKELGLCFDLKESSVSSWKSRGIPSEILLRVSIEKNVSLDWLLFDKEQQKPLTDLERLALIAFNTLDDKAKIQMISLMNNGGRSISDGITQSSGEYGVNSVVGGNVTIKK